MLNLNQKAMRPARHSADPLSRRLTRRRMAGAMAMMAAAWAVPSHAGTTVGVAGDAIPDFIYDSRTGDLTFVTDGALLTGTGNAARFVAGLSIGSSLGKLRPFEVVPSFFNTSDSFTTTSHLLQTVNTSSTLYGDPTGISAISTAYDLGYVLPAGLTGSQLTADLSFSYRSMSVQDLNSNLPPGAPQASDVIAVASVAPALTPNNIAQSHLDVWSSAAGWSKGTLPGPGDAVGLISTQASGLLAGIGCTFDVPSANIGSLTLSAPPPAAIAHGVYFSIPSGTLKIFGNFTVGTLSTVSQTGGSVNLIGSQSDLSIGVNAASAQNSPVSYTLADGQLTVGRDESIGPETNALYPAPYFSQSSGTHVIGRSLTVTGGGFGLSAGSLSAGAEFINGSQPQASSAFGQSGGFNTAGSLTVDSGFQGGTAVYNLSGGQLSIAGAIMLSVPFSFGPPPPSLNQTGGNLSAGSLLNSTIFAQSGGTSSFGPVSGTGTLSLGGGTSLATITVTSFAQNKITIGTNALLTVAQSTPRTTNTVTALSITGGKLDLGNGSLLVDRTATPFATVAGYVMIGRNNGTWNGTGIASTFIAASGGSMGLAVVDGAAPGGVIGIGANQVLVKPALLGDSNLDGIVDSQDYAILRSHFGQRSTATWAGADSTYDGNVDGSDYTALRNNFGGTGPAAQSSAKTSAPLAALAAIPMLTTGGSPLPAGNLVTPPSGVLQLEVDKTTGHMTLVGNGTAFVEYEIDSTAGLLLKGTANWNRLTGHNADGSTVGSWNVLGNLAAVLAENTAQGDVETLLGPSYFDLTQSGQSLWTGTDLTDLTFKWVDGNGAYHAGQVVGVPEPTTLWVIGLGCMGLMARRRRSMGRK